MANTPEALHRIFTDDPDLAGCFAVWLSSGRADWARGRYLSATWDVGDLTAMKEEIVRDDLLVNRLRINETPVRRSAKADSGMAVFGADH